MFVILSFIETISIRNLNKSGKLLLDLCREGGIGILIGRKPGDLLGNYTCITYKECSVVDYSIASHDLFNNIGTFNVHDFTTISDHLRN